MSHANPIFYMIDGFRYGFFGRADVSPWLSFTIVTFSFLALSLLALHLIRAGYKLRH
jgi:ABC-2 type transport system permease protein